MTDPFDSPRELVNAAKKRIVDIETGVKAFLHKDNWTARTKIDRDTGDHLSKIKFKTDIPPGLGVSFYDVTGYLRTALDQACYASAVALEGGDPARTKFPFGDTEEDLKGEIKRGKCKDMHDDVVAYVLSLRPYESGNRPLWALNKFRNRNHHRALVPASASAYGFGILEGYFVGGFRIESDWSETARQLTWLRVRHDAQIDATIVPGLLVSVHPAFGVGSGPAADALQNLAGMIEGIVSGIEAETARILRERGGS